MFEGAKIRQKHSLEFVGTKLLVYNLPNDLVRHGGQGAMGCSMLESRRPGADRKKKKVEVT
jgi:hypothetical protein